MSHVESSPSSLSVFYSWSLFFDGTWQEHSSSNLAVSCMIVFDWRGRDGVLGIWIEALSHRQGPNLAGHWYLASFFVAEILILNLNIVSYRGTRETSEPEDLQIWFSIMCVQMRTAWTKWQIIVRRYADLHHVPVECIWFDKDWRLYP